MTVRKLTLFLLVLNLIVLPSISFAQSSADPDFTRVTRPPESVEEMRKEREERKAAAQRTQDKELDKLEEADTTPGEVKQKDVKPTVGQAEKEAREETDEEEDECVKGKRACRVDRQVKEIESMVEETREEQKARSIWALPEAPKSVKGPIKVPYYLIAVPTTYVLRFLTWPIAAISYEMIKTGAINKVIDAVSNDERTFWVYPRLEIGFGNGFGGGVGVRHYDIADDNYQFYANYLVYVNLDQRGEFGIAKPDLTVVAGMPIGFRFDTKLVHDKDSSFYGIGNDSLQSNDSKYLVDAIYTGGAVTFEPVNKLIFNLGFFFLADQTGQGESPSVETVFPPQDLPGFGRDITYFIPGISIVYDWRDAIGRPERGGRYRGVFARYHGLGVYGFDFNLYSIELEQYIKLWIPRHVLALRTAWQYRQPTGGGEIPFFHLSRLDVYSPLRGFGWGRFRDRGSMVFNAEYRFPVWMFMDGAIFFDSGRVFHDIADVSFKDIKWSVGGGLRATTKNYFLFRLEVAYGGEDVRVMFKTSQAF